MKSGDIATADRIREAFLGFFETRGCKRVASSPLVAPDDPSTLFTPAGMHQFKPDFTERPSHRWQDGTPVTRACSVQKCLRMPDLAKVGATPRHHTFFEMLGFFSFDDFFKAEAIDWLFEFYTGHCALPVERLVVSVWEGDEESLALWHRRAPGLARSGRILRAGDETNFWPTDGVHSGPAGPCGPRCRIFFDVGDGPPPRDVRIGDQRLLGIGDLVFPCMERTERGSLRRTPLRNVDFGVGLERLVVVAERVAGLAEGLSTGIPAGTLDTSLFAGIRREIRSVLNRKRASSSKAALDGAGDEAERRIADLVRAATFCIADGVRPAGKGRGYVLRRIIRRAHADGRALGADGPFLHRVVPAVVEAYQAPYPELTEVGGEVMETVLREEEALLRSLAQALRHLARAVTELEASGGARLAGEAAFVLLSTHGVPMETLRRELRARDIELDEAGLAREIERSRLRSRRASAPRAIFARGDTGPGCPGT